MIQPSLQTSNVLRRGRAAEADHTLRLSTKTETVCPIYIHQEHVGGKKMYDQTNISLSEHLKRYTPEEEYKFERSEHND